MKKTEFLKFIDKYHMQGLVQQVIIDSKNEQLFTGFTTECKSMIGQVLMKKTDDIENVKFGVYVTTDLKKIISVMNDNMKMKFTIGNNDVPKNVVLTDGNMTATYFLSDPSIINDGQMPKIKALPDFEIEINLTKEFVNNYIKSKDALDTTAVAFLVENDEIKLVIGYSEINTNRITMRLGKNVDGIKFKPSVFNADFLKSLFVANKDFTTCTLRVSSKGLLNVEFDEENFESKYFLVKLSE
ncbi:MAG: hypothetical protein M0R17_09110 [Candidatus Omnitrophica bacterium]|jgi:hypothetical protein|nr:hypothetical protein [Candidatus Omnitrophota bacterium]